MQLYILECKHVKEATLLEWAIWRNTPNAHIVATNQLPGDVFISTVFVGVPPVMFETMVFGGEHDMYQMRYNTYEEAEAGHQQAIEMIFEV